MCAIKFPCDVSLYHIYVSMSSVFIGDERLGDMRLSELFLVPTCDKIYDEVPTRLDPLP
jgi:hypothetical protein